MGPHSERDKLQAPSIDLDFDLDGDTQIDVFVLSPDEPLSLALEREGGAAPLPTVASRAS